MATINDLYIDNNGFIACKENQTSNEWCKLLTELFKDWQQLKAKIEVQRSELLNYAVNVCPDLDSQIEQLKAKEIKGDRLLVQYSHQIDVLKAELKAAKEMEKNLYICNKCKSQINEKEIMQQVQDSKKSD